MYQQATDKRWRLFKYKQIQRDGREEMGDVQLVLDESRKQLTVFSRGEELEKVFYNMEVTKYPILRFKENNLYVMFNGQGQGFRLSFRAEDKAEFLGIMRKLAYISESPAKNRPYPSAGLSERLSSWSAASNKRTGTSLSLPISSRAMPPPKRPAARNLSSAITFAESQPTHSDSFPTYSPSPISAFSQPVCNSYARPLSSAESVASSIGSALSSLSAHSNYSDHAFQNFSQSSSSHRIDHSQSSQMSQFSQFSQLSQCSPHPFTPPTPPAFENKCIQTDGNFLKELAQDPTVIMSCVQRLMEQQKFNDLVKMMRAEIRKMPADERERFGEKTEPDEPVVSSSKGPPVLGHQPNSDLEQCSVRSLSDAAKSKELAEVSDKSKFAIRTLDNSAPIEKRSLSRGFAMNKFEKDFMIYPEYTDSDDVRNIEGFVDVLRKSLELSVDPRQIEKYGSLSAEVLEALRSNAIFSLAVGKEFGGIGMNNKDLMRVFEELNIDWNVYTNAHVSLIAANLVTIYGSEEQKVKYLPAIASGKTRPAVAIVKDSSSGSCEQTAGPAGKSMLSGEGIRVIGQHNANFYVVLGNNRGERTCFLLDETELGTTDKIKFTRDETFGLKGIDVGKLDITALVTEKNVLGVAGNGAEVAAELIGSGRMPFAAATIGMARRTLRELSLWCNRTPSRHTDRSTLADDSRAQRLVTDLALKVYALESSLYYLAGLIDEGLSIVVDIENSLLSILTRDVLQAVISSQLELVGVAASDASFPHEKILRDITTLLSIVDDGADVEQIGLATISTWATSTSHKRIVSTLKRWLKKENDADELRNPGLSHFIAEHAHPSLQMACQELEFSMARINVVVSKLLTSQGKNIEQDYGSLEALVNVLKNNLVMVSTISRASRSYSIGLRNADIELAWATIICSRLSRATWFELDALSDLFGLVRFNPSLLNAGRAVFDLGGYVIESPMEKNW
ncbi:unnamed protein product [Caenorhabditis sp. 36 PRJEB53466]|nr:unnamed protein product [Caenorhabditis sp. 36 PRJEB53466]